MKNNSFVSHVTDLVSKRPTIFRVIAAVIAFAIIAWLLIFAFSLVGDPVSYLVFKSKAQKYVAENYADKGYILDDVFYNFKFGKFGGSVVKPDSDDGVFTVGLNSDGTIGDDYERRVLNGGNTKTRLETRYRELAKEFFKSAAYPYSEEMAGGRLIFKDGVSDEFEFGLSTDILSPDAPYDIFKLGNEAGLVSLRFETEETTPEHAAELLLEMSALLERGGVPFHAVSLLLGMPRSVSGANGDIYIVEGFLRSDIYEEGLAERLEENRAYTEQRQKERDLEKEKELARDLYS